MKASVWLAALALFVGFGCGPTAKSPAADAHAHDEHEHGAEEVTLDAEQTRLAGIEVRTVRSEKLQETMSVPGTVTSTTAGRAIVTPPVAGRIVSLSVGPGANVRQGQTLAVLESVELAESWSRITEAERSRESAAAAVQEARSEVALAVSKVSSAKANLERQRELAEAGAFSQAPVQLAQSELADARSELASIQQEQASHADVVRRLENLYRDGIVSRAELEAARLELQQDVIRLERARSRIEAAQATYDRESKIASRGLLNAKELQSAESAVREAGLEAERARVRLRSSESALRTAERSVADARAVYRSSSGGGGGSVGRVALVAPISGTVTHLDATRGQAVDRTQAVMEIENLDSVWVTASVPEKDVTKVRAGSEARIRVAALQGQVLLGVVQSVGSRVDPKTRTVPVQCLVTGSGGRLKTAMFATVEIGTGPARTALAVPDSAVLTEDSEAFVFVRHEDGGYAKTEVTLGAQAGGRTEVRSGLSEGDVVVVKGAFVLNSELKKGDLKGHEH